MIKKILECVPNFSEGRDAEIINQIAAAISKVEGVFLLNIDPGKATNRTVMTFVGEPQAVVEAAFQSIKKAQELIDMRLQNGEHPRFGATDVCPLVPISGLTLQEADEWAKILAKRVGEELKFPVFLYEASASALHRKNLANVRSGEFEGLEDKLKLAEWQPDYGPAQFVPKTGSIAIGARNFLIAVNFNLNTKSVNLANAISYDVRESGRIVSEVDLTTGEIKKVRKPGKLKAAKAIGWYIEEYGVAQVSMNLTDIDVTPLHMAFEAVQQAAVFQGVTVTGTEIVGMIPLKVLTSAGLHFLRKEHKSVDLTENQIIQVAIKAMGLDDLKPFAPEEKVIEYKLQQKLLK